MRGLPNASLTAAKRRGYEYMEHAQILRIKKLKGGGIIATAAHHNLDPEARASRGNIDPRKTSQNIILRGANYSADVAAKAVRLMEQANVKRRKNEVLGLEILFSLPSMPGIAEVNFFTDAVGWAEQFFEIPILSAVIHNDEPAPHCHVILLPLFDRRMIGSRLMGSRTRLQAMQADFHAKVGVRYGLKRGTPAKRYSRVAMAAAADQVVAVLRRSPNRLDDPAIRDALRDAIGETMPVHLMELLGLDVPEVRIPKPKTFAGIMTKPSKPDKHIGFQGKNPIGFAAVLSDEKEQSLSCVGFPIPPLPIPPAKVIRHDFGAAARIRRLQTTDRLIPVTAGGLQV